MQSKLLKRWAYVRRQIIRMVNLPTKELMEYETIPENNTIMYKTKYGNITVRPFLVGIIPEMIFEQCPANWHCYTRNHTPIEPGDIVVDCGACDGYFTIYAASIGKHVYAIEPMPDVDMTLCATIKDKKNITLMNIGVSDKKEKVNFKSEGLGSRRSEDGKDTILLDTMDNILFEKEPRIDYIKADIEGAEEAMLRGAERILKRDKPKLAICVYHDGNDIKSIKKYLKSVVPEYKIKIVGKTMLHAWVKRGNKHGEIQQK